MEYLVLALIWGGYCILHSFLISISFTKVVTRLLKKYYAFYRIFYVLVSILLLIPLINYTFQLDNEIIVTYTQPWSLIRYVLILSSVAMMFWAFFFNYDPLSFFGIRQIQNFIKGNKTNSFGEIKKAGLLRITRHPMYFALLVFLWCQTFTKADLVVNTVLTIYIIVGTMLEEKKLLLEFGDAYVQYQQEVPMLIPFTKRKNAILKNT